jgi:hypothetical protein
MKVEVADPETCLELDMQPICQFTAGCAAVLLEPSCRATCGTLRICPQGYVCSSQPLQCELPDCNPETAPQDEVCVTESEL